MKRRWLRRLVLILAAMFATDLIASAMVIASAMDAQGTVPGGRNYDAAAVLYADTPGSLKRTIPALDAAVRLFAAGRIADVLCIGGNRPGIRAGEEMKRHLVARGVPAARVTVDSTSYDTRTNVLVVRDLTARRQHDSVVFVVHAFHGPRVAHLAARALERVDVAIFELPLSVSSAGDLSQAWLALHHEVIAWALLGVLSETRYDALIRAIRLG
jgi:uncharacterized SAM-binding protein YcdF (DUF218 family)